jgi:multidrug transporter EmrE-like cation transporter
MTIIFSLILASILLGAAGQLLLKAGMSQVGQFEFTATNLLPIIGKVIINLPVLGGVTVYFISLVMWLMVLSRTEVSFAYPLISVGYLINAIAAYYLFGESLSPMRLMGICIIIVGVFLVARSG